eukprot:3963857-Alexandrium_andersonii.AAC.1
MQQCTRRGNTKGDDCNRRETVGSAKRANMDLFAMCGDRVVIGHNCPQVMMLCDAARKPAP